VTPATNAVQRQSCFMDGTVLRSAIKPSHLI